MDQGTGGSNSKDGSAKDALFKALYALNNARYTKSWKVIQRLILIKPFFFFILIRRSSSFLRKHTVSMVPWRLYSKQLAPQLPLKPTYRPD